MSDASPVFRSGLVPPEGASGGEWRLYVSAGWGLAQAADLVRHGGRSATARTQGSIATRQTCKPNSYWWRRLDFVVQFNSVCVCVCVYVRWWTCPALWRWRFTPLRSSSVSIATWRTSSTHSSAAPTAYVSSILCVCYLYLLHREDQSLWPTVGTFWACEDRLASPHNIFVQTSWVLPHQPGRTVSLWSWLCARRHCHDGTGQRPTQTVDTKFVCLKYHCMLEL